MQYKSELYEPILAAAAKCGGAESGQRRIQLQNLPGDAAVFSGDISALVALAHEIWRICSVYRDKLRKRISQGANGIQSRRQEADRQLKERLAQLEEEASPIAKRIAWNSSLPMAEKERM